MPSPSEIVLPALPVWLALVLLLPKRTSAVHARMRATAAGERHHPFGPPLQPADGISSPFVRSLVSELPRCLELGVPLWLATLAAERKGHRRRRLQAAEHASSPAGWMWARALGRLGDQELERRLTDAGYPPLATKVERPSYAVRLGPPEEWLRDLAVDAADGPPAPVASGNGRHRPASGPSAQLSVQVLGRLHVRQGTEDLTADLLDRPTLSYIWQYLLIRAIQGAGPLPRSAVADEVYPGVDPETQHARMRRRIHDLQHKLPAFGRCLLVTDRDLQFDLESCDVDVMTILKLAEDVKNGSSGPALLGDPMVRGLEDSAAAAAAEPLPQWEELEHSITRGRGQSGEHVRTLRTRIVEARAVILARLGAHFMARRSLRQAVGVLDESLSLDPGQDDVVEMLARALEAAGDRARAADVRERYVRRE